MTTLQIAGCLLLAIALTCLAWPILREGRAFLGKRRIGRTIVTGVLLIAGATCLLAPKVVADGWWSLMPDRVLVGALDDVTDPTDERLILLKRRLGAGAVEPGDVRHMLTRATVRLDDSNEPDDWRFVTIMLDGLTFEHVELTEVWLAGLTADSARIREESAYALGTFRPDEPAAVPALASATDAGEISVRAICAWALRQYALDGELDVAGTNALEALLLDPASNVRFQAAEALSIVSDDPAPLVSPLAEGLFSSDLLTRVRAIGALASLGPAARPALPALEVVRQGDDESLALAASKAIDTITAMAEVELTDQP